MFKTTPPQVSYDELHAAALEGLWKASETWTLEKGAKFATHAHTCMMRCVIDWLRKAHRKKASKVPIPLSLQNLLRPKHSAVYKGCRPIEFGSMLADRKNRHQRVVDDRDQISNNLERLRPPLPQVIQGYFIDGYTVKELAQQYQKSVSWVSLRLSPYCKRAGLKRNRNIKSKVAI